MAEWGAKLAKQAHSQVNPPPPTDPIADTVLAGFKSLKAKVDQLAFDMASLAAKQATSAKLFAEAVEAGRPGGASPANPKAGVKGKKTPPPPSHHEFINLFLRSYQTISRAT